MNLTTRTFTVNPGGTLNYAAANVTGSTTDADVPNLVINQGTVTNTAGGNAHNYLGPQLTLNGGTLTGLGGGTSSNPQWNFSPSNPTGTVTVTGSVASLIGGSGADDGFSLAPSTTFNFTGITGAGGLTITVPVENNNGGGTVSSLVQTGRPAGAGRLERLFRHDDHFRRHLAGLGNGSLYGSLSSASTITDNGVLAFDNSGMTRKARASAPPASRAAARSSNSMPVRSP